MPADLTSVPFGDRAARLEPLARVELPLPARSALPELARVEFRSQALEAATRAALEALPGAVLAPEGPRTLLRADARSLAGLALEDPQARALWAAWHLATRPPGPVRLMGVVNATPDSFSDGGRFHDPERAVERGLELAAQGADLLDVGGESTRPGAAPVSAAEELERVLPVIEALAARAGVPISIDTTKAAVAAAALGAGASLVNDISAGTQDPGMLPLVAERGCDYVAMHKRGTPRDMQRAPSYGDPLLEVAEELRARVRACLKAGIALPRITLDPGIGFGKRLGDNLALLRGQARLRSLGRPLLLGVSRKSFLGTLTGVAQPADRLVGTAAAVTSCVLFGAEIVRVHEVQEMREAVRVAEGIGRGRSGPLDPAGGSPA